MVPRIGCSSNAVVSRVIVGAGQTSAIVRVIVRGGWVIGRFDQIYSATRTTLWGCCIAFMVYVSLSCQGSILTGFLSLKFWTPIMSLTYGWYLLHPLWIQENYGAQARQLTYTDFLGTDMWVSD